MSLLHGLIHRVRTLLRPGTFARELDEELRFHLDLEAMQRSHDARRPLAPADAAAAARRRLGNTTVLTEETRRMAGLSFFDMAQQDVRFAWRSFRRTPAFTLVAVLTLAIGIGANTAIFSAVNALLLRPLPFREPERLMKISMVVPARGDEPARDDVPWSYPKYVVFRDAQRLYASLTAWDDYQATIRLGDDVAREPFEIIDSHYFPTLGVQPQLGRNLAADEDSHPDGPRVTILSHELWQRAFNADPAVLGHTLDIDGKPYTIIGVMPEGFRGLTGKAAFWTPLMAEPAEQLNEAWSHSLTLVGRLKDGVTPAMAKAIVPQLGARVDAAYPNRRQKDQHWGATATELDAIRVDPVVRRTLLVLLGAVGLVLLIACANVANLFLVRASGRRREIAVRLAVGAGRGRLVRQLLTESVLLSTLGGAASLLLAWWSVKALASLEPAHVLRLPQLAGLGVVTFSGIRLDPAAFAFAAALAIATGVIFGLIPALLATRPSLTGALKDERAEHGVRFRHVSSRTLLAVAELALALVLLVGSGLMLRSLGRLLGVRTGIDATQVLTMRFNAGPKMGRDSLPALYDAMLERLSSLPGVTDAALGNCAPLSGGCNGTVVWRRDRPPQAEGTEPTVGVHWITPQWAKTLHVPLVRGRMFTRADRVGAPKVVVVSEAAARRIWPNEDPIGKPVSVGQGGFSEDTAHVIGVIGDVRFGTVDSLPRPEVFLSYFQSPYRPMLIFVRTQGDPLALASAARRVMHEVAPQAPIYDVQTLEARVAGATSYARFSAILLALFAVVALALATLGVYGVISFAVAQRTREIGVRVALGASRSDVMRLVVGQGVAIAVAGGAIGVAAALAVTRVLRALLYDVAPTDPWTFAGVVALMTAAVVAASWIPARRATAITPSQALREG